MVGGGFVVGTGEASAGEVVHARTGLSLVEAAITVEVADGDGRASLQEMLLVSLA